MKIKFEIDEDSRSIILTPENDLEKMVITEMAMRTEKGSQLKLTKILHYTNNPSVANEGDFIVELKVNGH